MSPRMQSRSSSGRSHKLAENKRKRPTGLRGKGAIGRARLPYTKKSQHRKLSVSSTEDSDVPSELSDEGKQEDESDEAADESDVPAPSYSPRLNRKAGLQSIQKKKIKKPEEFDTEEEQDAFFADSENDDEIYGGVDDISDDDEDVNAIAEGEYLAAQFVDHPDVAANFLGDVDGFSVFGFDNDVDRNSFSSSSDSSEEAVIERHVHFDAEVERRHAEANPESPRITAFRLFERVRPTPGFSQEELRQRSRVEEMEAAHRAFLGDLDPDEDSDVTDDDLPVEAHTAPSALEQNPLTSMEFTDTRVSPSEKKEKKSPPRRRGPILGLFEFDGDKPWAVLDPSGTKVHIAPARDTNRHDWLEKKDRHAINQALGISSAESSPHSSFATLLDDSDCSVTSLPENGEAIQTRARANLMMCGLNSGDAFVNQHGYATGPPEAFYPPIGSQILGDYLINPEDLDQDDDDIFDPTGEDRLSIHDFIEFDGEDDEDDEEPTSPTNCPEPTGVSTPTHRKSDSWSHLNSDNVLSFRRNADPSSASRNQRWNFEFPPTTPVPTFTSPITRKRKARSPPYQGEHYRGVTVVERKLITPSSKRRRANTMH